jgi:hypothetical protein
VEVTLREPTGEEELLVLEAAAHTAVNTVALLTRLATGELNWRELPAVELSALALLIRRAWLGDRIRAEALCPTGGCDEPIDVAFIVSEYLEHHRPRRPRGLRECEPGWFALGETGVRFRIPTIADVLDLVERPDSESLLDRCVQTAPVPPALARRLERALDALAPRLDGGLTGTCPNCARTVELRFEPISYVLEELREACAGLFSQIHDIAFAYHWPESTILALPRQRRRSYVAMIRQEEAALV